MIPATLALAAAGVVGTAGTAQAYDITCGAYGQTPSFNCVSYSGYTGQQPWGYPVDANGHNCTNYTSYRLWQNGVANPGNLGYAKDWDNNASSYGFLVNNTPAVGSIAVWEANVSPAEASGHVAYVEAVTATYIDVSEDNFGGTTMLKRFYVGQAGWPSHFIHFKDLVSVTGSDLVIRQGSVVSGKANLADAWTTLLPSGAVDIQAAGTRIAVLDSNSTLWVKDGIGGTWINEAGGVTQYSLTTSTLVIRQGSSVSAKANLSDPWTLLWSSGATDVRASGTRIAFLDASGTLRVKDGIGGTWINEYTGVSQYAISPSLLLIRTGGGVMGKANLSDAWATLWSSGAVDIQAAGTRIAVLDSNSTLWVKDGISSAWINEQSGVSQYGMTQTLLVIRQASSASAKVNLTDAWTVVMPSGVADVQAGNSRIALLDTSGNLWAKDQIDSAWYNEANSVTQFALSG